MNKKQAEDIFVGGGSVPGKPHRVLLGYSSIKYLLYLVTYYCSSRGVGLGSYKVDADV